jgi:hypothetical protein
LKKVLDRQARSWYNRRVENPDEMLSELERAVPKSGIAKVRYTHDAMIDMVVENPWVSQNELGARFGYTATWVSLIFSSDAFRERLHERKAELVDPQIRASIEERLRAVTAKSLDVLLEKLNRPVVADNLALRAAELGARGMGTGGFAPPQAPAHDHLEILAQRLIALKSRGVTYEAENERKYINEAPPQEALPSELSDSNERRTYSNGVAEGG